MARFDEAEARILNGQWICMNCGTKQRAPIGKKPVNCRKCKSTGAFRIKHKAKKK